MSNGRTAALFGTLDKCRLCETFADHLAKIGRADRYAQRIEVHYGKFWKLHQFDRAKWHLHNFLVFLSICFLHPHILLKLSIIICFVIHLQSTVLCSKFWLMHVCVQKNHYIFWSVLMDVNRTKKLRKFVQMQQLQLLLIHSLFNWARDILKKFNVQQLQKMFFVGFWAVLINV